ncbi:MAG TPA: ABC transporter permease [Jatrophihabitantaceae bacterium]|jgi:D-xylose transport system permease protein|nr:ABC transporter permease [Jatrophihabitantaceae bacterium]
MTSLSKPSSPTDEHTSDTPDDADAVAVASTAPVSGGIVRYTRTYLQRVRGGDMGSLPAATGLVILIILFSIVQETFAGLYNFGNLLTEGAGPILLAMGLVFVLLLGEIDLSAGYAAGVCAAVMVRLTSGYGSPWPVSIGAAIVTGVIIGFVIGWLRAKVRIPSFVVTLAFFLAFQGVMLYIVNNGKGQHGDIGMTDKVQLAFENSQMPVWMGWAFGIVFVAGYAVAKVLGRISRMRQKLAAEPLSVIAVKVGALAIGVLLAVYALNKNRALHTKPILTNVNGKLQFVKPPAVQGVPWVVLVIAGFFVLWTFLLARTRYGRHVYAVGGNEEAARRAGIPVDRIRISVFVLCSGMAAVGGIMIGSNVSSVSVANYGGNTLLLAVGAAVIGGTSLFGGKGKMIDALVGGAVVEVIQNGMSDLVKGTNSSAVQYVITGLVLLLAAAVDALSRRRAGASGLG